MWHWAAGRASSALDEVCAGPLGLGIGAEPRPSNQASPQDPRSPSLKQEGREASSRRLHYWTTVFTGAPTARCLTASQSHEEV